MIIAAATLASATLNLQLALPVDQLDGNTLSLENKFALYKEKFGKTYTDEASAFSAFTENDKIIQEHNSGNHSWTLGHNEFSDLTWEQFSSTYVGGYLSNPHLNREKNYDLSLLNQTEFADSVDWVTKGAVTPVKNQAQCGSCWAFSTVGSFEGGYQIAGNPLTQFSEEDLVACDNRQHGGSDQGCNGGLMDNAFKWIEKNGLCLETDYPYTSGSGKTGTCKTTCKPAATLTGFQDVPSKNEDALKAAIMKQPISVAIEADKSAFQLYKGGVLDNAGCGTKLDHGVLIVGYGTDGKDYYKVKNSWGATWGEKGYIRLVAGKNQCGISQQPSYPTGVKPMGPGPGPGPAPGPSPPTPPGPAPTGGHYEDPKGGCSSDEEAVQIQGVDGDFCSPECTGFLVKKCPTDVPSGVTAQPQCALQDASGGPKRCALICSPTQYAGECGAASCKSIQGLGICTYDD